jgi:hypothetical protein
MVQMDAEIPPVILLYLPAAHVVQAHAPNSLYLPLGQGVHEPALSEGTEPISQEAVGTQPLNE